MSSWPYVRVRSNCPPRPAVSGHRYVAARAVSSPGNLLSREAHGRGADGGGRRYESSGGAALKTFDLSAPPRPAR